MEPIAAQEEEAEVVPHQEKNRQFERVRMAPHNPLACFTGVLSDLIPQTRKVLMFGRNLVSSVANEVIDGFSGFAEVHFLQERDSLTAGVG